MTKPAKIEGEVRVRPNLVDYEAARRDFSWESARSELSGLPGGRAIDASGLVRLLEPRLADRQDR